MGKTRNDSCEYPEEIPVNQANYALMSRTTHCVSVALNHVRSLRVQASQSATMPEVLWKTEFVFNHLTFQFI